jgi:predicted small metal-binding protein
MKTMTCREMGGPCDLALQGETADEVIKAMDKHLRDAVAGGDQTHEAALQAMKGRWKNPIKGMGWYMKTKKDFAALPEGQAGGDPA